MNSNIKKLVDEMDGVSAVLQTNKAASEDMAAGSRDLPHSIESIPASDRRIILRSRKLARGLQTIVAQFILAR